MRDKVKRFISILMTALMLVNLLPVGALADGIASGGYQQATIANGNQTVYLYVKVTGNLNGLNLNKSGWCTVGKVTGLNMTDPQSYAWWYGSSNHVSSVSGISASSVGKGDVERYEKNQSIDLSKVTWASGTHYGFLPVSTGADDYVGSGWTWHLDGYIDIAQVQASYKIRYVDQDTNNVLKIAASGTDDPGVWIDHSAPKKLDGGYEIVGDTDRTFKLEQIDNTFDIYYRRPYGYTVEYYYDDVKDEDATVIGERQMCGTKINTYTQKPKDGYELDRVENFPLTIQADESKNVIKVYYKKIGYTVTYEPGEHGTFKTQKHDAKHGDPTPAFDGEATGEPGWTFAGWEPEVADKVTGNATYTAKFVPDKTKTATVLYTISIGQSDYGSIAPSAQQIILQATGKLDSDGGSVSGSTATAKTGYKFAGWYKATGEATYEKVTGDPKLTSELAESTLNRDKETGLYQNTVFEARFEPDEKQTATVTYTAENGTVTHASDTILQADASGLTGSTATPNPGYKFDGWYKGDERITTDLTLTPEMAKDKLDKDENGLYVNATFTAKCKLDEDQNATVLYTIFRGQSDYGSIAPAAQQIILQATGKLASGDPISGSTATANKGYKFVGWYKVTGWTTEWITEWITDKPELTPELAEQNLTRNEQGLYQNTVFAAKFELDENDQAEVIYQVENGTILNTSGSTSISQFVQVVTGEVLTDVTATPNPGYKFDGWYKGDERITTDLTLTPEMAKDKLDKDENGLYVNTTFTAKCVLDEDQNATVIYTIDETQRGYGSVVPSIVEIILQATGKLANGNPVSGSMATANPGYKFVGWYKATGEATYEKVTDDPELTSELAESELNRDEKTGLYRNTVFEARFELDDYAYTVEHYWIGDKDNPDAQPFHTDADESQTAPYGSTVKYEENGASWVIMTNPVYTFAKADPEKITISADASQNVLKLYYYKNVKLTANSDTKTYNGEDQSVSGYTCAVAEMKGGRLEYVPWTGEKPLTFEGVSASGSGKDVNKNGYQVEFNEPHIGKNDGLYYVIESQTGILMITPRPVTLTSASASKPYDGKPLTNETVTVGGDGFADGEGATYKVTGSQTVVGESDNTFTYTLKDGTKAGNYEITPTEGTLKVTPVKDTVTVTIKGNTASEKYDGTEKTVTGYTVESISNPLYKEGDFTFSGNAEVKGTDAGTYPMKLTAEHFTNKSDNFSKVTFVVTDGYVKITPRAVTLTSETAGKTYDGTALEKPVVTVGGDGFVEGQVKEIKATGSVTNAGSVANTITFTPVEGKFNAENYNIQKNEGALTIAKRSVLITSQSATKTYDGSALTRPAVTITGDGFVPGELAKAEATGSITNVGSTPNAIQYTTTGAFNAANYSIALSVGTLTVTEKPEPEPRRTFNLTVNYVYQNGKRAAASYNRGGLKNGETFDITSPVIAGYTASETVVSGTIDNRDIKVTVIYTADGVNLDDYGVPLGLGNITMNVGDCFE